jgi:hypothetical protein
MSSIYPVPFDRLRVIRFDKLSVSPVDGLRMTR